MLSPFPTKSTTSTVILYDVSRLQAQAIITATKFDRPVSHPAIDKIRACSAAPNDAVDFFTHLFHIIPDLRLTAVAAQHHRYLARAFAQMQRDTQANPRAAERKPLVCKVGEHLRLPQVLGMVKHVAGSIIRRESQHEALFPKFSHRPRDHKHQPIDRPKEMENAIRMYQGSHRTADGRTEHRVLVIPPSRLPEFIEQREALEAPHSPAANHNQPQMQRQPAPQQPSSSCLMEEVGP